jgi:hypothetical protein
VLGSVLNYSPMFYKGINIIMEHQQDLVQTIGYVTLKVVHMFGDERFREVDG